MSDKSRIKLAERSSRELVLRRKTGNSHFDTPDFEVLDGHLPELAEIGHVVRVTVTLESPHTRDEWARAFAKQGASDLGVYRSLGDLLSTHEALEDFVKRYWKSAKAKERYAGRGAQFDEIMTQVRGLAAEIERLAPAVDRQKWPANAEYPWSNVQDPGYLWKAHGTLHNRASWVFVRRSYDRVMFGEPQYRATFGAIYRARKLLFVGYSQ